jgi:hypothetical protein
MTFKPPTRVRRSPYVDAPCAPSQPIISDSVVSKICIDYYHLSNKPQLSKYDLNPKLYWDEFQKSIILTGNYNPPPRVEKKAVQQVQEETHPIVYSYMYELNDKYPNRKPPLIELIKAMTKAGYSEDAKNNVMKRNRWWKDNDEDLDAEIERRWPSTKSSRKSVKTKILKAVKKV